MSYDFGDHQIDADQVFYISPSKLIYATVNLKPIVEGHVLIVPVRKVVRIKDMTRDELYDLISTAELVGRTLEQNLNATAQNVAIQDGKEAGQSVPHVHCHILPRKAGDFERTNDVHELLEKHDATPLTKTDKKQSQMVVDDDKRKPRTKEEMKEEATKYRQWMQEAEHH
ncbi:unnamed protein product [Didymodactylos carnosus]|uniref:bis(5'-adenosyl)-triphosphatase n=1 Tax=Didymodactylos carnosus TaxID=1234261 RepID=A0A814MDW6_9BILA|nr:unnamed protein product [Didymodactylos carnosus]CAF1078218.1 unnamed protein product [Didymodactylos carnosus]CAF3527699.1 unnamed protein product [Didymodactylos carnosus]CAF3844472.1 unnamed protein product [Didymodactylos carnosus]